MKIYYKKLTLAAKICTMITTFLLGIVLVGGTILVDNADAVNAAFGIETERVEVNENTDEDNYYYLIALLMAFLYHNNGYNEGYSALDIKRAGTDLEIGKIANLDTTKLETFMDELKELNVLRNTEAAHYLFTRFQFFQMMGTRAEVDDELEKYMGE